MTHNAVAHSDDTLSERVVRLCRIFQVAAICHAFEDKPLHVIHAMLQDVGHRVDSGDDVRDIMLGVLSSPVYRHYNDDLCQMMARIGLDGDDTANVAWLEGYRTPSGDVEASLPQFLRMSDVFARSYARKHGDQITATFVPRAMQDGAIQDFLDRHGLTTLKHFSVPAL